MISEKKKPMTHEPPIFYTLLTLSLLTLKPMHTQRKRKHWTSLEQETKLVLGHLLWRFRSGRRRTVLNYVSHIGFREDRVAERW